MSYARATICGNIGRAPETRFTPTGNPVTQLSVAVTRGKDESEVTDWYSISCWGDLSREVAKNFTKGSRVKVEGRLQQREYIMKDGTKRLSVEIIADTVAPDSKAGAEHGQEDTIPF